MGWYYGFDSRKDLINKLTETETNDDRTRVCLAKFTSGNTLWTVWEVTPRDKPPFRYIRCDLLSRAKDGDWGHKPMIEDMGPCYYSCPLKYLEMVPETNPEWREKVRRHHAQRDVREITIGTVIGIKGPAKALKVVHLRPIHATTRSGMVYRVPPKFLTGQRWPSWEAYELENNNA